MSMSERHVVLVGFEGIQLLDMAGPADVFDAASRVVEARGGDPAYRLTIATTGGGAIRASSGMKIEPDVDLGAIDPDDVDTLLVVGGPGRTTLENSDLVTGLPRLTASARRVGSICGGAFLLAAAGLLDGRRVTTHWAGCDDLARRYPAVSVEPDRIYVRDGDVITSAGVTAGIDLALALVEEDHGAGVARTVARWLVVFLQRPGGQSQFSERLQAPVRQESPVRSLVDEIVAAPAADHRVAALAERAALSERQLSRVFAREVGTTPARYVERVRVEAARDLLEASDLSVDAAAERCGFRSAETMRCAFIRVLGIGPGQYRQRFGRAERARSLAAT